MPPQDQSYIQPQAKKSFISSKGLCLVIIALLFAVIAIMILIWKPWQANIKASDRTITVTGNSIISAKPDQYTFSPSYEFTNADKQTALSDLTAKSTTVVTKLKSLGVSDSDIKTNSSGYGNNSYYLPATTKAGSFTYTLYITVKASSDVIAQKIQDYLVTTSPVGEVSPSVDFSPAKKILIQNSARDQAEKDAKKKADQSASNLGFKVDRVKSVQDGNLDTGINNYLGGGITDGANAATAIPQLKVQPGQNDLNYSVNVVYYIH